MTVGPITGIAIAATDEGVVGEFLGLFGLFDTGGRGAQITIIDCDHTAEPHTGFECGPRAIDLYVSDLDLALKTLPPDSYAVSPVAEIRMGPVHMRQVMLTGPDAVQIVLVESTHRRPSLLDEQPNRMFSEIHSVVWCVPDRDEEARRWVAAGFTKGMDLAFEEPSLSPYLGLPKPSVPIEMVMLSDEAVSATRLELLSFPGNAQPAGADDRRGSGIRAISFAEVPACAVERSGALRITAGGVCVSD